MPLKSAGKEEMPSCLKRFSATHGKPEKPDLQTVSISPVWQIKFVWTLASDCAILYNIFSKMKRKAIWSGFKIYAEYSGIVAGSILDRYAFM